MLAGPLCCQFSRRCNSSTPPQAAKEAPAPRGPLAAALGCPRIASWILPTKEGIPGSAAPFAWDVAGKLCHHDCLGAGIFCLKKRGPHPRKSAAWSCLSNSMCNCSGAWRALSTTCLLHVSFANLVLCYRMACAAWAAWAASSKAYAQLAYLRLCRLLTPAQMLRTPSGRNVCHDPAVISI